MCVQIIFGSVKVAELPAFALVLVSIFFFLYLVARTGFSFCLYQLLNFAF